MESLNQEFKIKIQEIKESRKKISRNQEIKESRNQEIKKSKNQEI